MMKKPKQAQFLYPDEVYLVSWKDNDGERDTTAFSDKHKALTHARDIWREVLDNVTDCEMELASMREASEVNECGQWRAGIVPCHAWMAEHCYDEVWVELLQINH